MKTVRVPEAEAPGWRCALCDCELVPREVELTYMESLFRVELPTCPRCGQVCVAEGLAQGRMHEVERLLEDK